jgi:tRNA threonylcarbamoyladenosine biosynthesis protein TsaE
METNSFRKYSVANVDDMALVSGKLLSQFPDERIYFLKGNLGAGKTTLIQCFCDHLGVRESVVSPSFALVNIYDSAVGEIYHLDLYRLKDQEEAVDLGIEDYLYSGNYCFIEWPELIEGIYISNRIEIQIEMYEKQKRIISVTKY